MKKLFAIPVFAALLALFAWGGPDSVVCSLSAPSDGGSVSTSTCSTSWPANSTVMIQCTADVYMDIDNGTVNSSDWKLDFTNNVDPIIVYLRQNQRHINLTLVTPATGQTCKLGPSPRPKPEQK